jgi:hypothetical protein
VRDSGIGISKADMEKLFQAFSQIDSSLARKFEGTGLGLAMVKLLAELHGGSVAVASLEERRVLRRMAAAAQGPGRAPCPAPRRKAPHVTALAKQQERIALVVEDDDLAGRPGAALLLEPRLHGRARD